MCREQRFCQVSILHDIDEVVGHDALEKAEIRVFGGSALEVCFLSTLQELVTTLDGQEECVCVALSRETKLDGT
jgi:hypothetical protein